MTRKQALSGKIESEEAFNQAMRGFNTGTGNSWWRSTTLNNSDGNSVNCHPWWQQREVLRIEDGVYTTTQVLDSINQSFAAQYVVHISIEDPTQIAYTRSTEDGCRDKRTRTSLGKFLRQTFILLKDSQIQQFEADHRAELTGTFELATTASAIRHTYQNMEGDSGCMRYGPEHFNITNDRHPSEAYEAPGMGVAYTKDSRGRIKSRAVVWVNPSNADDKRYVRIYGDPILGKILIRSGYKQSSLKGATLAIIPRITRERAGHQNEYVMPYLDGPGGNQGSGDGAYVMLDKNVMRIISQEEAREINDSVGVGFTAQAKTTSAYVTLMPVPAAIFTSEKTGLTYEGYTYKQVRYWDAASTSTKVCEKSETSPNDCEYYGVVQGSMTRVYADSDDTPTFRCEISGMRGRWIDTFENREHCHMRLLSEAYYEPNTWGNEGVTMSNGTGRFFIADAVQMLPENGDSYFIHKSKVAEFRKLGYINASPFNGMKILMHRARPTLARTDGGSVFDTAMHASKFVECDGTWHAKSSVHQGVEFGVHYWYVAQDEPLSLARSLEMFRQNDPVQSAERAMVALEPSASIETLNLMVMLVQNTAMRMLRQYGHGQWAVGTNDRGDSVLIGRSNMSWTDYVGGAHLIKSLDCNDADGRNILERDYDTSGKRMQARYYDTVKPWVTGYCDTLLGMIQQKEMEAAGQQRLTSVDELSTTTA